MQLDYVNPEEYLTSGHPSKRVNLFLCCVNQLELGFCYLWPKTLFLNEAHIYDSASSTVSRDSNACPAVLLHSVVLEIKMRTWMCFVNYKLFFKGKLVVSIMILLYIKKNEIMPFAATRMDLEIMTLSEVSQKGEDKYHMISLMHVI